MIQIATTEFLIDPVKAFRALFDNSPNPMCLFNKDKAIDCNESFTDKCGFNTSNDVIKNFELSNYRYGYENDLIADFKCKTVKGKSFGGVITLSDEVSDQGIRFGFIQFKWIDGLDKFYEAMDAVTAYIKNLRNES